VTNNNFDDNSNGPLENLGDRRTGTNNMTNAAGTTSRDLPDSPARRGTQAAPTHAIAARYLSAERLKPYLSATNGHQKNALTLYRWNVAMSGAVYQALHYFEVVLRNAMDEQLSIWNATQLSPIGSRLNREWAHEPAAVLDRIARKDIDTAYERAQKELDMKHGTGTQKPSHHDVIAQTSFGLWRFMLPSASDQGKQVLWTQCLAHAFPHITRPPEQLATAVHGVYILRNRVAHLEPLLSSNVPAQYRNMVTVTGDIDPDLQSWFASVTQAVTTGLRARPTFAPQ
jgi:hypothetical protein